MRDSRIQDAFVTGSQRWRSRIKDVMLINESEIIAITCRIICTLYHYRTNPTETGTGKFGLELRNERGNTLVEWGT